MFAWIRKYWIVLVLIGFLIAIIDVSISSMLTCHPPPEGSADAIKTQYAENCSYLNGPVLISLEWLIDFIDNHDGFFVVLLTGVLAVFTGTLWRSTDALFRVTKIVADADRPHMLSTEFKLVGVRQAPDAEGNVQINFKCRFKNYGRSPAFIGRISVNFNIGSGELPPMPQYEGITKIDFITPVDQTFDIGPVIIPVAANVRDEILNGIGKFIVFGFVEYTSTAWQTHINRYATRFIIGTGDDTRQHEIIKAAAYREYT